MTRRYAYFDHAAVGADLAVERGGAVLTTIAPSLSIYRTCRLTVGQLDYESFAEFVVYGASGTSIANKVSIGVVTADASLSTYVGGDEFGLGYRLGDGAIHNDGGSIESVTAGDLGDAIGVRYVPDGEGGGQVIWYRKPPGVAGVIVGTVAIPAEMQGVPIYLAASIGSTTDPGDISLLARTGLQWYENPVIGNDAGWWEAIVLPGAIRFGAQHFVSSRDDAPAYTRWERGIVDSAIRSDRRLYFPIWGTRSNAPGGSAVIEIDDGSGRLNRALGGLYRDAAVELVEINEGDTLANATPRGRYIVERIDAIDRVKRRVTLRGPLAKFEVPILRREVRPDADTESAFQLFPCMIGPVFSFEPLLIDKSEQVYAIDAVGVTGVGKVRTSGDPLDPTVPDYFVTDSGRLLELESDAFGVVTIDAGATGGEYNPPDPIDLLDGSGSPFDGVIDEAPDGWEVSNVAHAYLGHVGLNLENIYASTPWARAIDSDDNPIAVTAGTSYRIEVTIASLTQYPDLTSIARYVQLQSSSSPFSAFAFWMDPGTYVLGYTPSTSHNIYIGHKGNNAGGAPAVISSLRIIELPSMADSEDTDEIDETVAALALSLESMLRYGIETVCGLPAAAWDSASAAALDSATGFAGQGFASRQQLTLRQYIDLLLAPYCASVYETWDGRLAVARLIDPETVAADHTLTLADIIDESEPQWDDMPGLTLRAGGRRNEYVFSEGDLASEITGSDWRARRKLMQQYRIIRSFGGQLAPGLDHARAAAPLDTRLVHPADIQACVNHMGSLAQVERVTWELVIRDPQRFELGTVLEIPSSRFPEGSRRCYLFGMTETQPGLGRIAVWCRAPWDTTEPET